MIKKKSVVEGWPLIVGDYFVGDAESAVAVVTLGSHMDDIHVKVGAGISGSLHTENLGIEKVIGNTVANPNIRFMVICGAEVQGHISGQSLKSIHENGTDPRGRIIGAKGAIPFVENISKDAIQRFQDQVEVIDIIDTENLKTIHSKIKNCLIQDTGAYEEETLIIPLREKQDNSHPTTSA